MTQRGRTLRLATRGSELALRQASQVRESLEGRRLAVELVEVETTGDNVRDELIQNLGTTGAFVRSLDERVLDGDLDAAVHSMKDVPTDQPEGYVIAGVPHRGPAADVLVTPDGTALEDLPEDATVGTASLRRGAQLLDRRPDLQIEPLRGNVDTRVEKLLAPHRQRDHERRLEAEEEEEPGDDEAFNVDVQTWFDRLSEIERRSLERTVDTTYDAIVLAEAGLERIGLLHHVPHQRLDPTEFVPAPGQGTVAVAASDPEVIEIVNDAIDHPRTRAETTAERTVLGALGAGCVAPIGIYARLRGAVVNVIVRVLSRDGSEVIEANRDLPVERHAAAAAEFAEDLRERGAADLIEQARRSEPDPEKRQNPEDAPTGGSAEP
jgi:hydroxymethylbilane synthase